MKKRLMLMAVACTTVLMMTGCTTTKTVTTTDADGNTVTTTTVETPDGTTTTTTEETTDGVTTTKEETTGEATYYENVPMTIENSLGGQIAELYISFSDNDEWGENVLAEGFEFADGISAEGLTVSYSEDNPYIDILAYDMEGNDLTFENVDLSDVHGEPCTLVLEYSADDDEYYASVK